VCCSAAAVSEAFHHLEDKITLASFLEANELGSMSPLTQIIPFHAEIPVPRPPWPLPWVLKRDGTSGGTDVHFVTEPAVVREFSFGVFLVFKYPEPVLVKLVDRFSRYKLTKQRCACCRWTSGWSRSRSWRSSSPSNRSADTSLVRKPPLFWRAIDNIKTTFLPRQAHAKRRKSGENGGVLCRLGAAAQH
jgi:hypothetical protein